MRRYAADLLAAKAQPASFQALLAAELSLKLHHPFSADSLALSYPIAAAYAAPGAAAASTAPEAAQPVATAPSTIRAAAAANALVTVPGVGTFERRQIWMAALGAVGLLYLGAALGWVARRMGLVQHAPGAGGGAHVAAPGQSAELPLRGPAAAPVGVDVEQTASGQAGDVFGQWPSLQQQQPSYAYGGAGASILDDDDPDL